DLDVTTIYVTHDQVEAMTMGDRVAVMRDGFLQQVDVPQTLYDRPRNLFVAEFIGSPAMNLVQACAAAANGALDVEFGKHRLRVPDRVLGERRALSAYDGRNIVLGIRPEDLEDAAVAERARSEQRLSVETDIREDMGAEVFVHFSVEAEPVRTEEVVAA